ncbi:MULTISPECIES: thiamine phosphate synthase [unclassified Sphingomonas]|jgi:thiamine-phosphate pyrophosphorylase|uniref:thiamine phosphate synthase n=1 Tax=unclassified Sphingomonas TaxID=196159 RepID=UPI00082E1624|nr:MULTISPECIES: thiamine phosphate synthase [unclassified Sphingomonas]
MPRRHPIPRTWLMTDERLGDALFDAIGRLPRGSGIVFRHYATPPAARRALFARVVAMARRRGHLVLRAGPDRLGREDGVHNARRGARHRIVTRAAHDRREAIAAIRAGADALFVSPIFGTRSHPGARALGRARFGLVVRGLKIPVIAMGGVDAVRAVTLARFGIHGWAAIDAWAAPRRDQKRKAVPI